MMRASIDSSLLQIVLLHHICQKSPPFHTMRREKSGQKIYIVASSHSCTFAGSRKCKTHHRFRLLMGIPVQLPQSSPFFRTESFFYEARTLWSWLYKRDISVYFDGLRCLGKIIQSKQGPFRPPQHHSSFASRILTPARAGGAAGMPVCLR